MADMGPRYVPTKLLGSGVHGQVWQCTDEKSGSRAPVAVKVFDTRVPKQLRGLERELVASVELRSRPGAVNRHLVAPHACVFTGSAHVGLVQRLAPGQSLDRLLLLKGRPKRLGVRESMAVFAHMVEALDFCHNRGMAHLDMKAENVVVVAAAHGAWEACLCDFGLSTATAPPLRMGLVGSFGYIPPEVLAHGVLPNFAAMPYAPTAVDVWAAGALLHKMLLGCLPYGADEIMRTALYSHLDRRAAISLMWDAVASAESWRKHVDPLPSCMQGAASLLDCMLQKDPRNRPPIADVLASIVVTTTCGLADDVSDDGADMEQLRDALFRGG
ncbi:hypothetical protein OEZ85_011002 [Tetradesmus obliquus]|uniref:Protein kinase domain-containing protein n=1 Tax=Tetradesmus obliquus TaxID=3088 RepID=A0ABY8TRA7_TETOB|nr:hypothetical protein OEZ85_011002 [Tetradesmus obliquus]